MQNSSLQNQNIDLFLILNRKNVLSVNLHSKKSAYKCLHTPMDAKIVLKLKGSGPLKTIIYTYVYADDKIKRWEKQNCYYS